MTAWRFFPLKAARDWGVLVTPERGVVAARFLTPLEAREKAKAEREARL